MKCSNTTVEHYSADLNKADNAIVKGLFGVISVPVKIVTSTAYKQSGDKRLQNLPTGSQHFKNVLKA